MVRPAGVTVIAVIYIVGSCFLVLMGLLLMIGGSLAGGAFGSMLGGASGQASGTPAGAGAGMLLGAAGGLFFLLMAAVHATLAWGMLKLKEWARIVSIVLAVLGIIGGVLGLVVAGLRVAPIGIGLSVLRLAIAGVVLWYLVQPHVKAAFRGGSAVPVQD